MDRDILHVRKNILHHAPVAQEHPMGCAVACVASLKRINYQEALKYFEKKEHAWTRGYYCPEVVEALNKLGFNYKFEETDGVRGQSKMKKIGTIVFISPCTKYPSGHFVLRVKNGWMNPWANFPLMSPVKAAIEKKLAGKISYIIFPDDSLLG
jgi:hypothetical protein